MLYLVGKKYLSYQVGTINDIIEENILIKEKLFLSAQE